MTNSLTSAVLFTSESAVTQSPKSNLCEFRKSNDQRIIIFQGLRNKARKMHHDELHQ
jgi:hypothetical protein